MVSGISQSNFVTYSPDWSTYIDALKNDATSNNDSIAIASLPGAALSSNIIVASANGRAVGGPTAPAMFANGTVGSGGPYDGIVTVNSAKPFQFNRPIRAGFFDAQRAIEHEIDEVIGFGSHINHDANLRPQDLFSWSSAGVRNVSSTGTRYFSINSGSSRIVSFNQTAPGDFGDWLSGACPQTTPYVQNASGCTGQVADISATSAEGINLDVIRYDFAGAVPTVPRAFLGHLNGDSKADYVLYNPSTRQTAVWYLNNNVLLQGVYGPTIANGWSLAGLGDFNGDAQLDYVLFNRSTGQTAIWYLSGVTLIQGAYGPTLPTGWRLAATGDFDRNGKSDYVLYSPSTRKTAIWYINNNVLVTGTYGPTLPPGWNLVGVADFNRDGALDYMLFNANMRQSAIWYLSGALFATGQFGPTIASGYQLVGTADFNGDSKPDELLYGPATRRTAIWYLNNQVFAGGSFGPDIPPSWAFTPNN